VVQFFLFGWVEGKRWMDFRKPNSQAEPGSFLGLEGAFKQQANGYPGGILFDPLGFSRFATLTPNDAGCFELLVS
jgi:light-harvesting complex I chlorophyll a/b binding protein 5